ncbi:MAG: FtsX-like permease family protein [Proteobacteria bacterium]|nr:FtsX-like permease family protein [Pseudomonadota bacterium]
MHRAIYQPGMINNLFAVDKSHNSKHNNLPESYIAKIKTIPYVVDANPCQQVFTYFEKSTKVIGVWGIIPDKLVEIVEITRIDGLDTEGLSKEMTSALVGYNLMKEYNWKIGDRIILKSGMFQEEIPFTIRGIVHGIGNASDIVYLNLRYIQEVLNNQGRVSFIYIKVDDPSFIPQISQRIEAMFRNYPVEINAFAQKSFMDSIVDKIKAILIAFRLIGWITIITTFLLVANCIAISIRERTIEIGVMRVLGFSRAKILALVLAESILVAICGGMLGAVFAYLLPILHQIDIPTAIPLHVNPDVSLVVYGLFISILIGFWGGIFPSLSSVLKKPSDAIRGIG